MPHDSVLGVPLALTDYERTLDWIDAAVAAAHARLRLRRRRAHRDGLRSEDPELRAAVRGARFTVPDGQPLVWALNAARPRAAVARLRPRPDVDAPASAPPRTGTRFYLYGGRNQGALVQLALQPAPARIPGLQIVGGYSPPFRDARRPTRRTRSLERDQRLAAPTSCGSASACPSRRSGWRAMRAAARRAGAGRRRRGVRLPRRARPAGAGLDAAAAASSGRSGSAAGAAPPVAALPALQPALRGRASRASTAATLPARVASLRPLMSVRRLGHRPRPRRPAARALLRRPRPRACSASTTTPTASTRSRRGRMPFEEPGTQELLERVHASGRLELTERAADAAQRRRTSCSRSARRRSRTSRSTCATSARCSTTCCRCCATGHSLVLRSTVAPGTTEFVAGYLEKQRGFARRRGRVRRPRARADRRRPLPRGDRDAAVHRRRRRRGVGRARGAAVRGASARRSCRRRRCRPSWRRSGPTSCATRRSRCPTC